MMAMEDDPARRLRNWWLALLRAEQKWETEHVRRLVPHYAMTPHHHLLRALNLSARQPTSSDHRLVAADQIRSRIRLLRG